MNKKIVFCALLALVSLLSSFIGQAESGRLGNPFSISIEKKVLKLEPGANAVSKLIISCPPGHYIYKEKTFLDFIALDGVRVAEISYPAAKPHQDPFSGKMVDVFDGDVAINVTFAVPKDAKAGEKTVEGVIVYQGCSPELCFREMTEPVSWSVAVSAPKTGGQDDAVVQAPPVSSPVTPEKAGFFEMLKNRDFKGILAHGLLFAFIAAFIGGLLTSLTPCILPIIPVTLLVIGVQRKGSLARNFLFSLSFVVGIGATYATLGLITAAIGLNIGFLFQERIFIALLVIFFVVMSLSMFGLFEIQLPLSLRNRLSRLGGKGFFGSFLAGISVGLLAAPCVGPVLGPLLIFVATTQSLHTGFWLLATYAMGMGLLILVIGTFYGVLAGKVKGRNIGVVVKKVLAVLLLLPAIYYGRYLIPNNIQDVSVVNGGIAWVTTENDALKAAKEAGAPIMIDFYADWCPPCQDLKKYVFTDPEVVELTKGLVTWRVDATLSDEESDSLMDKYDILGLPTILFASPEGIVYDDLTLAGDIDKKMITKAIAKAIERSSKNGI